MTAATVDATAIWPSGRTQRGRAKASKVMEAADAIAALEAGAARVFVAPEDAGDVVREMVGEVTSASGAAHCDRE